MIKLKKMQNGLYGKTAIRQLEDKGLANIVGDKVYYWNEDANVFVMCGTSENWHKATVSVLKNLGYDIE